MPEASPDATIMIATSWQALGRAETGDERTMISNCTVIIVFAAFYIEANLNHIIETTEKMYEMMEYYGYHSGLKDKLAWFYVKFCADDKLASKKEIYKLLNLRFPGFDEIYNFRNSVSHGVVERSLANLEDAKRLRSHAKNIVDDLFLIAKQAGYEIPRGITYEAAISTEDITANWNESRLDAG